MLLFGPPYNRSLDEIGWLTRKQISKLALSHRDKQGILDLSRVKEEENRQEVAKEPVDRYALYRTIRRRQAVPEYIIDREIANKEKAMRAYDPYTSPRSAPAKPKKQPAPGPYVPPPAKPGAPASPPKPNPGEEQKPSPDKSDPQESPLKEAAQL